MPAQHFEISQINGKWDVGYVIGCFEEVADVNKWTLVVTLLHIKGALKNSLKNCGRAADVLAVFASLQARFGFSLRGSFSNLSFLKRKLMFITWARCKNGETGSGCLWYFTQNTLNRNCLRHVLQHSGTSDIAETSVGNTGFHTRRHFQSQRWIFTGQQCRYMVP